MNAYRLSTDAQLGLRFALSVSAGEFGSAAALRCRNLFEQAFQDLITDPTRPGVRIPRAGEPNLRLYHLRHSRLRQARNMRVRTPRHYIAFRPGEVLEVLRILHDSMDLPDQLSDL